MRRRQAWFLSRSSEQITRQPRGSVVQRLRGLGSSGHGGDHPSYMLGMVSLCQTLQKLPPTAIRDFA